MESRRRQPAAADRLSAVPRDRRPRFRLPEPVEVENPIWQARAWQELFGAVNHLEETISGINNRLADGASVIERLETWQQDRDTADLNIANIRAERRRLFHYGYLVFDFLETRGWMLVAAGALIYGLAR
jgi:hypothetical protein